MPNQKVYCWAKNGINIRKAPDKKSNKIRNVPFRSELTVIDTTKGASHSDTLVKDKKYPLIINGNWLQIKCNSDTGYVFDGYISRIPVQSFYEYFALSPMYKVDTTLFFENKPYYTYYELYISVNGGYYKMLVNDGCWEHDYYLPDISFEESVMMMRESFGDDEVECQLKLIDRKGFDYFFAMCTLTTLRLIRVTKSGVYIFTHDCT